MRRRLLAVAAATAVGLPSAAAHAATPAAADPRRDGSGPRIPGDFEPAAAVWLGYDGGHEELSARLIDALLPHVPVSVLVRSADDEDRARLSWLQHGIDETRIDVRIDPQALYFLRDAAVWTVGPAGLGVVDFRWNEYGLGTWCRRRHAGAPAAAALCGDLADETRDGLDRALAALRAGAVFETPLAIEGGGVESNGQGLLIANEALWTARNPDLDRDAIERELLRLPGVRAVVWLPEGLAQDPLHRATIVGDHVGWGTGGHTDEFVRFADPRTVLLAWAEEPEASSHPVARLNAERMARNHTILSRTRDADGRPLRVVKVPLPRTVERRVVLSAAARPGHSAEWTADDFPPAEGRRQGDAVMQVATTSYLNFVVANDLVLLPDYVPHGTPRAVQNRVQAIFERVFPGREVRFIDAIGANWVGGGLHCAVLNEPRVE